MPGPLGAPGRPGEGRGGGRPSPCWERTMPRPSLEMARAGPLHFGGGKGLGRRPRRAGRWEGEPFWGQEAGPSLGMWQGLVPGPSGRESPAGRPFPQPRPQRGTRGIRRKRMLSAFVRQNCGAKVCLRMFWQAQTLFVLFPPHRRGQHGVYSTNECSKICKTL